MITISTVPRHFSMPLASKNSIRGKVSHACKTTRPPRRGQLTTAYLKPTQRLYNTTTPTSTPRRATRGEAVRARACSQHR